MDVAVIGCGYVADFYMLTLVKHPDLRIVAAMDIVPAHADRFGKYWKVPVFHDFDSLIAGAQFELVINLTNPEAHYSVSKQCLEAGKHVYSEKPFTLDFEHAKDLARIAAERGLLISGAPCNHLSEAAQATAAALKEGRIGRPHAVFVEMNDLPMELLLYKGWRSPSGAPWPYEDEFEVGCTLEHAAYALTWLLLFFGPVKRITAVKSLQAPGKPVKHAPEGPDFSVTTLEFHSGMIARLTCSLLTPIDHSMRIFGDKGVIYAPDLWFYRTPVYSRTYFRLRRGVRLTPWKQKIRQWDTGPAIKNLSAGTMDFARGPREMSLAIREGRKPRVPIDFVLHFTELTLAIQNSTTENPVYETTSTFEPIDPVLDPIL